MTNTDKSLADITVNAQDLSTGALTCNDAIECMEVDFPPIDLEQPSTSGINNNKSSQQYDTTPKKTDNESDDSDSSGSPNLKRHKIDTEDCNSDDANENTLEKRTLRLFSEMYLAKFMGASYVLTLINKMTDWKKVSLVCFFLKLVGNALMMDPRPPLTLKVELCFFYFIEFLF